MTLRLARAALLAVPVLLGGWALLRGGEGAGMGATPELYEPSAAMTLADGRVLVAEDEAKRAFRLLTVGADGGLSRDPAQDDRFMRSIGPAPDDLEGLAGDAQGRIYAITSHSSTRKGARRERRERLLRFAVEGGEATGMVAYGGLRDALSGALSDIPADFDDLEIEGLAYDAGAGALLLGLRAPLVGGRALVIPVMNPAAVVEGRAGPQFGPPALLDLQGSGIRALGYDPVLETYLIASERDDTSRLWTWDGTGEALPLPAISLPENVEAFATVDVGGERRLLLLGDDGSAGKDRPATFRMIPYDRLMR